MFSDIIGNYTNSCSTNQKFLNQDLMKFLFEPYQTKNINFYMITNGLIFKKK